MAGLGEGPATGHLPDDALRGSVTEGEAARHQLVQDGPVTHTATSTSHA